MIASCLDLVDCVNRDYTLLSPRQPSAQCSIFFVSWLFLTWVVLADIIYIYLHNYLFHAFQGVDFNIFLVAQEIVTV